MKKIIQSIFAAMFVATSALAQIPNSGFENWTTVGSYSNPDGWGTMNNTTAIASVYTATKGTPGSPGTSYLKLTSKTVSGFGVVNGIAVSGVLDSMTMTPKSGFAYAMRPVSLTGKWQHMIYGSSQGSIQVTLTRWDTGMNMRMPVASGSVTLSGMAMSWANFSIPLTYVDGNNPDTCIIIMKASGSAPTNNDYLWVDNLAFSGSVTGIENQESLVSEMTVFPNPSSEVVNFNFDIKSPQQISVEISDINGKLIRSTNLGKLQGDVKHSINIAGVAKGTYLVRIVGERSVETRKLIIE
ncbi:MAG: T9SS type A sorting domain-containing protein [Bacteroidetes bacterium]|nr:T9SS type A sorting domain-containing protein [Bacteroidota bacterium]